MAVSLLDKGEARMAFGESRFAHSNPSTFACFEDARTWRNFLRAPCQGSSAHFRISCSVLKLVRRQFCFSCRQTCIEKKKVIMMKAYTQLFHDGLLTQFLLYERNLRLGGVPKWIPEMRGNFLKGIMWYELGLQPTPEKKTKIEDNTCCRIFIPSVFWKMKSYETIIC